MRFAGFFRELDEGHEDGPPIEEARGTMQPELVSPVAAYLERGTVLAAARRIMRDHFAHDNVIGALAELTDGSWVWPSTLSYYVKNYRVGLPLEFIEQMKRRNWVTPKPSPSQLTAMRRKR